ncbi:hypothetical protein SNE40_013038 [Patella caerulea]|uniref:Uncharacterized protein n=1 Tax=Patella caerulea TaxID=87958 RepID=A0AAN8PKJ6_PATCE
MAEANTNEDATRSIINELKVVMSQLNLEMQHEVGKDALGYGPLVIDYVPHQSSYSSCPVLTPSIPVYCPQSIASSQGAISTSTITDATSRKTSRSRNETFYVDNTSSNFQNTNGG